MPKVGQTQLRAAFARKMAEAYGREVPAYNTLVQVATGVNADVLARDGAGAERLGSVDRVTRESPRGIPVGTPARHPGRAALLRGGRHESGRFLRPACRRGVGGAGRESRVPAGRCRQAGTLPV